MTFRVPIPFGNPFIVMAGPNLIAPANGTVMVDTGSLDAGAYFIAMDTNSDDSASYPNGVLIARRNASNTADIAVIGPITYNFSYGFIIKVVAGERIVIRKWLNGSALSNWNVQISGWNVTFQS